MVSFSVFESGANGADSSIRVPRSEDYRVFVNGAEVPVYACRISAYPFNRVWPGFQRPLDQSEVASYVNLVADEAVCVEVEPLTKKAYDRIMLKPYAKGIAVEKVGDRIAFTFTEHGGYILELDDYHGLLYLFYNKPVPCEDPEKVTYYFGKGVHFPGKIILKSNESIYLDKDALVYGCVYAEGAENLHIYGNGIFDDGMEKRLVEACFEDNTNGNLKFYDCKNLRIEGVGLVDSAIWCVNFFHCFDVVVDGVKVFGQWRYNTDGVDIVNSQRVTVRNSFVHSFDDTIVVKGIDKYAFESNKDILTEHCVLLCDWGKTLEIGLETECDEYDNVVFRNCHVLRGGNAVCDIQNGDRATVHNVSFENLTVELEGFYTPEVYQREDAQVYDQQDVPFATSVLKVNNPRFREIYAASGVGVGDTRDLGKPHFASVCHISVRNVYLYADERILETFGTKCASIFVRNRIPTTEYKDISVENVFLNGKKLTENEMNILVEGCPSSVLTVR